MNNVQFATLIAGFVVLLASLWGGAWMNQRALENQTRSLERQMDSFKAEIRAELKAMAEKVDRIERQLEQIFKPVLPR
jgi:uncharacterized membrane-anchored protein YhcB (DUF1043 family)